MLRSDNTGVLVIRFIWNQRKSLCKLCAHMETKTASIFPSAPKTSLELRKQREVCGLKKKLLQIGLPLHNNDTNKVK